MRPPSKTYVGHYSVDYQCASICNGLPRSIRVVSAIGGFKVALRGHLLACCSGEYM